MPLAGLTGKVAVVTGSSQGIGRAIAERLAAEGCRIVVNGLDDGKPERAAAALRAAGTEAIAVPADVGLAAGADAVLEAAVREFGGVDVLVNNAGWAEPISHLLEMTEEHWDTVLRTNLKSVFLFTRRAADLMVERGRGGAVVSISSWGATRAHRAMAAYDASKAGIEAFTRTAAVDLAPFAIRVNAVAPGVVHTEGSMLQTPEERAQRARPIPLGRLGSPADVAAAVAFLASDEAEYITGQVLYVDGGIAAQGRPPFADHQLPPAVARRLDRQ
ncbi:MAG TPA: glucose 1-dehydrogenase [Candidatus Dormibacteraeota bacterium]|nr:glucose 1-dehydrogenase [Candidatus Dormibacteraeota bacterium]